MSKKNPVLFLRTCLVATVVFLCLLLQPASAETQKNNKPSREALAEALAKAISEATEEERVASKKRSTSSEVDEVVNHIAGCWIQPVGLGDTDAAKTKVDLEVEFNPDGTVKTVIVMDKEKYERDKVFRMIANSARIAVMDCQPLPFPEQKYESWKKIIFNFNLPRYF